MSTADCEIYYEEFGSGYPVLAFAPGALGSQIAFWRRSPTHPSQVAPWMDATNDLASQFRVIAMDQRNAGRSRAQVRFSDDWRTYAYDHIALLDYLNIEHCHTIGACIGVSFALSLCKMIPERISSTALLQPIGRTPDNESLAESHFREIWAPAMLKVNPEIDENALDGLGARLFGNEFVHSVTREFVASCGIPMLIAPGTDHNHPLAIAEDLLRLAPRSEYIKQWKAQARAYGAQCVRDFFGRNTPL